MRRKAKRSKGKGKGQAAPVRRRAAGTSEAARRRQLEQRLAEALAQQAATAEILRVIGTSPSSLEPVFDTIADRAMRLCGAVHAGVMTFDGELVHLVSHVYVSPDFAEALRQIYPMPPGRSTAGGRAILTRAIVHIPDIETDRDYRFGETARAAGFRSTLAVPMLRAGQVLGAIVVLGREPVPFSEGQIALLQAFADQAAIAIENVRLFTEVQTRNRALAESLRQQTATGEILQVISSSPTDVQPVFEAIARRATLLCEAANSGVFRFADGLIHLVAHHNWTAEEVEAVLRVFPLPPGRGSVTARAILTRGVAHVPDLAAEPEYTATAIAEAGFRTTLSVPMLLDGRPVGAITVGRMEVRPFGERQVALLETFADQAVIAIENVRLFTELEARNRDLRAALEQQTATADVLKLISRSTFDLGPVLQTLVENATRLAGADGGLIGRFDGEVFRFLADQGASPEYMEYWRRTVVRPGRGSVVGRAVGARHTVQIVDVLADPDFNVHEAQRLAGYRTALAVPMLKEDQVVGAFFMWRTEVRAFTDQQVDLATTFADQAAIAMENARLLGELQTRNGDLTESLQQQTATSDILRAISSSPTDVQPVFDMLARSARQLCDGEFCFVLPFDGTHQQFGAADGLTPGGLVAFRQSLPRPASEDTAAGRAILSRTTAQIPDVREDPAYGVQNLALTASYRSVVSVPMLREGHPIGAIAVARAAAGFFPDRQVELLRTFADQAVIAVENVRLFRELEARNRDLTATSEILRVISSSPTDLQPVFDAIAASAARLCESFDAAIYRRDGDRLVLVAHRGPIPVGVVGEFSLGIRGTGAGRAVLDGCAVHVVDTQADAGEFPESVEHAHRTGFRTMLCVPLMREGVAIGAVSLRRTEVRPFTERQVALLQTFADQAVIAIENVRLFQELEARNRDLTETLEQQTATSEVLRVISSSPTDVQPVLDTVVESAARLCEALDVLIMFRDGDRLRLAAHHGPIPVQPILPLIRGTSNGRAVLDGRTVHVADMQTETLEFPEGSLNARRLGHRTILCVPLMREGVAIGTIHLRRTEARLFTERQVALLETFADQAVIAIENVRLFQELEARNRDLTETLEQQTATAEVLKVISRSAFDLQPVLETLIENASRLCHAEGGVIYKADGELQRMAAAYNISPELRAFVEQHPLGPGRGTAVGRAMIEGRTIHIHDVREDPTYTYGGAGLEGYRTILGVPMMREGVPVGVFSVWRREVLPFTDKQIELVTTFADQGAIAIENVRLFRELEARTQELTRSVSELKALGEVSQAVGSTLDLETVLATIVSRAVQLSGSDQGVAYEFDEAGQSFHVRAADRIGAEFLESLRAAPIRLGQGAIGRAGVSRRPVEVVDIEHEQELVAPQARRALLREGIRSLLAVPLVREDRLLGALAISRRERGAFSPEVVAVLQTFATQSVLAIHNARLFREIRRQKQHFEALVETSPVAIVTVDLRGGVVGWNPGAERLFGYPPAEALGHTLEDLVATTPELRGEVRANIRRTLEGEWIRAIGQRARKDGTLVDVEISSVPVVVDGARVGMIGIFHDITELLHARREAEAANEAKSAFLATMSHEIRTPMNAVIGMSGLLLNTALTDEQREYAEVVRQSGDALLTVINDVLDFSKIEAGRLELESQPFDLRECVEGALDLVATRAAEKGLDLAYLLADGTPPAVVGDVTRLRQILLNLLSNAVKFTERGEVVLSVSARRPDAASPLHEVTFSVRDTGIGIPPDRLGRLFQSFSQVDASTTRRYGGTGLGLAISQRLSELMGGRIEVTSAVGTGSDFHFTIRAAAAEAPVPTRRDLSGVQPSLRGKRVLAVDDNATNRRILSAHLEAWGMAVRTTGSPVDALEWIRAGERFEVAVLDMHMPEMDGVTLARAIREQPAGAAVPLILFTSLGRREARAEEEGFAAYLHKPIKPSQLFDALVSVLAEQPVLVHGRGVVRAELDPAMAGRHPLRILVAEDNVVNQKVTLRILGQMGYRADVASNGLEAIEAVARQAYDVVLMDVQMPELDGFEASREINRRWPGAGRPRIVAMTANAMQGDRELCEAAGMDDYVAKPIRVEELIASLERTPRRAEAARAPQPGPGRRPAGVPSAGAAGALAPAVVQRLAATMGSEFVVELIDTFAEDARDLIGALRGALTGGDLDAFRRAAHSLKSTGETLGAFGLAAIARDLEGMARAGSLDGAADRIERLAAEHELVARRLGELRHDLSA